MPQDRAAPASWPAAWAIFSRPGPGQKPPHRTETPSCAESAPSEVGPAAAGDAALPEQGTGTRGRVWPPPSLGVLARQRLKGFAVVTPSVSTPCGRYERALVGLGRRDLASVSQVAPFGPPLGNVHAAPEPMCLRSWRSASAWFDGCARCHATGPPSPAIVRSRAVPGLCARREGWEGLIHDKLMGVWV